MKNTWVACFMILCSCAGTKYTKQITQFQDEFQGHVGLLIKDLDNGKTLVDYQSAQYFTPASNTKILTLYASLEILGDSIPALHYVTSGDSLIFWGAGDPSFLYNDFTSPVLNFLKSSEYDLYYSDANFFNAPLGSGWSWDDFEYQWSAEITPLPMYGNAVEITKSIERAYPELNIDYFKPLFFLADSVTKTSVSRSLATNDFFYAPGTTSLSQGLTYKNSGMLTAALLSDTLKAKVRYILKTLPANRATIYNHNLKTQLQQMMQESDNFLAEHHLLNVSGVLTDSLETKNAITILLENQLHGMPDKPRWVDGSGLSRYNAITPRSLVWLLEQLYERHGQQLFDYMAVGGVSGTLKNYYKAAEPYIFAKTGTMTKHHNLSGFLITRKGKLLVFSFMNNNYATSSYPVKKKMEEFLYQIHLNN